MTPFSEELRIYEMLSASEIMVLIGQEPNWKLPPGCSRAQARMAEALRLVHRDYVRFLERKRTEIAA